MNAQQPIVRHSLDDMTELVAAAHRIWALDKRGRQKLAGLQHQSHDIEWDYVSCRLARRHPGGKRQRNRLKVQARDKKALIKLRRSVLLLQHSSTIESAKESSFIRESAYSFCTFIGHNIWIRSARTPSSLIHICSLTAAAPREGHYGDLSVGARSVLQWPLITWKFRYGPR